METWNLGRRVYFVKYYNETTSFRIFFAFLNIPYILYILRISITREYMKIHGLETNKDYFIYLQMDKYMDTCS